MYRRTGGYWQCHRQEPGLALGFRVFGCFGLVGLNGALRVRDLFGCHPDLYRSLHSVSATNEAGVPGNHGHLPAHIDTFMRAVNPNGCPVPLGQGLDRLFLPPEMQGPSSSCSPMICISPVKTKLPAPCSHCLGSQRVRSEVFPVESKHHPSPSIHLLKLRGTQNASRTGFQYPGHRKDRGALEGQHLLEGHLAGKLRGRKEEEEALGSSGCKRGWR